MDNIYHDEYEEYYDDNPSLFSYIEIIIITLFMIIGMIGSVYLVKSFNEVVKLFEITPHNQSLIIMLIFKISFCIFIALLVLLIKYRLHHYSYESLSSYLGFGRPNWKFLLVWVIVNIGLAYLTWGNNFTATNLRITENIMSYGVWLTLLNITLVTPICEELFFRGFLWRAVLDISESETTAFWISGGLFTLAHLNFSPVALLSYMFSSWLYLRARIVGGTLIFAIVLHFYIILSLF